MDFKLEDSTSEKIPHYFIEIIQKILSESESLDLAKQQIFLTMIMYIIFENGLIPNLDGCQAVDELKTIDIHPILKWKQPSGIYEIPIKMTDFIESNIVLMMVPVGSYVLLDILIKNNNHDLFSSCIPVTQYVSLETSDVEKIIHNIKHLSFILKDQIINPAKSSVLSFYGYVNPSLTGLPQELLFNIVMKLPVVDIVSVAKTCMKLNLLLKNDNLWHKLFKRDFKTRIKDKNIDWKTAYIEAYSSIPAPRKLLSYSDDLFFSEDNFNYMWTI